MLNIRKRFFLLLTIIGLMFVIASCTTSPDYVKVTFDSNTYEVKVGQTLEIEPLISKGSNVGAVTLEYSSYDDSIATYVKGKLTGVETGEVVIKVVCNEKPVAYDTATVKVVASDLPEVEFGKLPETIYKGESVNITYKFIPAYAEATVAFSSANPDIATVDENGVITGTGLGTAVISVRVTDVYGQYRDYNFNILVEPADYDITYDLDGGENHVDNRANYNTLKLPITLLEPTKAGYKFLGWYDSEDQKVEVIKEGTEGDISLKAKWELVTYSISYNKNGGSYPNSPWPSREAMIDELIKDFVATTGRNHNLQAFIDHTSTAYNWFAAAEGTKSFFADKAMRTKWTWLLEYLKGVRLANGLPTDTYDEILKDGFVTNTSSVYVNSEMVAFIAAKGYAPSGYQTSDYSLEANKNGFWAKLEGTVSEYTIHSETIKLPTDISRKGYTFLGWFSGDQKVEEIATGSYGNVSVEARWEIIEYTVKLEGLVTEKYLYASREAMIDELIADFVATTGRNNTLQTFVTHTSTGYNWFAGNSTAKTFFANAEMRAKWSWLLEYAKGIRQAAGLGVDAYDEVLKDGYVTNQSAAEVNVEMVAFIAAKQYAASEFASSDYSKAENNNGFWSKVVDSSYVAPQIEYKYTVETGLELPTPSYEDWTFLGWFNANGEKVENIQAGTIGDMVLTAHWYKPNAKLNINYNLNEGALPEGAATSFVAKDGLAELPVPTRLGYTFKGWFLDAECTQSISAIEAGKAVEDVTVYASWEVTTYEINYELNGGEFQTDKVVSLYDSFEELTAEFINDYSSFFGLSNVTPSTFYGKSNQYGVYSFFKNEAMAAKWGWLLDFINELGQTTNYAGKASLNIEVASVANFNKYMRVNLAAFLQEARITNLSPASMNFESIDGEALWAACPTEEIKVGIEAKNSYTVLDLPLQLASPFKEGATFVGWYLNANLKDGKVESITEELLGNVKLYARWTDSVISFDTYEIKYELNGGELGEGSPVSYVEEQGAKLVDPSRKGYLFKGWFLDAECTKAISELTALDKGDKTLYACWEAIEYNVKFEVGEGELPTITVTVGDYVDYAEFVAAFITDFNKYSGKSCDPSGNLFFDSSWTAENKGYAFLTTSEYATKWSWVLPLLNEVRAKAGKEQLTLDGDGQVSQIRGEIHCLLNRINGYEYKGSVYGSDYSQIEEVVWTKIQKKQDIQVVADIKFTVEDLPLALPEPTPKEGQVFYGWYLNAELSGDPIFAIPAGTANDVTVYAKYIDATEGLKYSLGYELNGGTLSEGAPAEYIPGTALPLTATVSKEGYTFTGWYLDAACTQLVTEISAEAKGPITLYAGLEINKYNISLNNDGNVSENQYVHGDLLPVPQKDGHVFKGWYENIECTGEAVTVALKDATLYACWEEIVNVFEASSIEIVVDANGTGKYTKLDDAISAAQDGQQIKLLAGEYELSTDITKSVVIKGEGADKTIIKITRDNAANVNAESITFDSVSLLGTGGGSGISGVYLQPGSKLHYLTIKNSVIAKMNTVYKGTSATTKPVIFTVENCEISEIGQFFIWVTAGIESFNFIGNNVNVASCGNIVNEYGAILRVRAGSAYIYNNVFTGKFPQATYGGIIEFSKDAAVNMEVKYNTFNNNDKILYTTAKPVVFDENLYLDENGQALSAAPSMISGTNVTPDATVATSEEDRVTRYSKVAQNSTIKFHPGNGSIQDNYKEFANYSGYPLALPQAQLANHKFLGWCTDEGLKSAPVMTLAGKQDSVIHLYAKYQEIPLYKIEYELSGGELLEGAPTEWREGFGVELVDAKKEGYAFDGWYDNPECTGNAITSISDSTKADIKLYAKWIEKTSAAITYKFNGGNMNYADRDALANDLLADINRVLGQELTPDGIYGAGNVYGTFFADEAMFAKWSWLIQYFYDLGENGIGYHAESQAQYLEFLAGTVSGQWAVRQNLQGFLTKTKCGKYSGAAAIDFTQFGNAEGFWDKLQVEYKDSNATELLTPYRPYYVFEGWYDNAEFSGEAITTISTSCTLYAKWSKDLAKVTYVLNNDKATLDVTEVLIHASETIDTLATPKFDEASFVFNGWYSDPECTNKVEKIGTYQFDDITLYASWSILLGNEYNISYQLNGGNWLYDSREQVVADYLADFNRVLGANVAADGLYAYGNYYHNFYDDKEMLAKWSWLLQYFYNLGVDGQGYHSESQSQYQTFLAGNGSSVSVQWAVRQNTQGFMTGTKCGKYSSAAAIDFSVLSIANGFWDVLNASHQTEFENMSGTTILPIPKRQYYKFGGWYTNPEFSGDPVTEVSSEVKLYAKWEEEVPVESVAITNKVQEMKRFSSLQLVWDILPAEAVLKDVNFSSSDKSVATISDTGLIEAIGIGTVTIRVTSLSPSGAFDEFTINVYEPGHFEADYATNSYVEENGQIKLNATYVDANGGAQAVTWSSLNSDIATVDASGAVTGVKAGLATIRASLASDASVYFDFIVTVLGAEMSAALKHAIASHESNVFTKYNLGIGAGTPEYYSDIFGSVSKLFYNHELKISDKFLEAGNATNAYYKNSVLNEGLEFITVHYTGTMGTTADADNIASNFTRSGTEVSIHYVTGNPDNANYGDGTGVYNTLSHDHGAYHAGDSNAYTNSNFPGAFKWYPTGVTYDGADLLRGVKFTASDDFYFEINGVKTDIKLPSTWNYKSRNTNHIYNADGTITSRSDFTMTWAKFENRTPESFFDAQGFPVTVINGEYYMGPTWWSYGQVVEGRICGSGGNRNSIGIESCVNEGSDLWYTWQTTAQLVAKLLVDNNLTIDRVKGHHFFDGKDCPQPLLENDLEIWWEFIELVEAEHALLTTYKDAKFSMKLEGEYDFVSEYGRITEQPEYTQVVKYTVTVEVDGKTETITLASLVDGIYNK